MSQGRLTLPIETGIDEQIRELAQRLQPDAVRNSDGTELPEIAHELVDKVYSTYFPARGDNEWADKLPGQRVCQYLMSEPVTAQTSEPLKIDVMEGYFAWQFAPDLDCDRAKYWQVIDRTTGQTLPVDAWSLDPSEVQYPDAAKLAAKPGPKDSESKSAIVTIHKPQRYHVYTVNFLARQIWDSTQMYNYLTNDWALDPKRRRDRTYDVEYPQVWAHVKESLAQWLDAHPEVDVVRFTTFFYHFTLVFDDRARERYVDWFGYSASVSIPALEAFEQRYGYALTPEDFVDAGFYNSPFRIPSAHYRDWMEFTGQRVREKTAQLVKMVHAQGKEAMMFLGDNWIGTEPYSEDFEQVGLDAVVGSVGNAATCRMISDIPGVRYREGRLLPYFFPDVFNDEGDPVGEARASWRAARRAIIRKPLERIGYGGYLSLALKYPKFVDEVERIVTQFRQLHDKTGGRAPAASRVRVGVLNAWGSLRSWQTHMVAHALPYRRTDAYVGVIEALAGLPFDVRFVSFDEVKAGALQDLDVIINAGSAGTAFSGGEYWADPDLLTRVREFVARGGGFIGVGEPSALPESQTRTCGNVFALDDVLGLDIERDFGLSRHLYTQVTADHFVTRDLTERFDAGPAVEGVFATRGGAEVLDSPEGGVSLAVHEYGAGRAVYFSGLPYSVTNARLLHRALYWAGGCEEAFERDWTCDNPAIEVAYYPNVSLLAVSNITDQPQEGVIHGEGKTLSVQLGADDLVWLECE
ncbi:1,3-beta-galactosyl-N-acetylhexosamine phosphorylase [Gleimia hominis]|uniref:1,3-beta-galactosyl-N-acetylhexosamine phosphorylase n=1 Tax=Gleimia hominis TaxID=595468 RepID=A0ABU3IAX6_9ACTO|nr:1,3-beta-galactosyl-N-acetylhexosamine phosphorylase [Gleimia hominis]MDT3767539.1 1,3-beta-galactosyl-N-acetylhexosamine phosphorylase [Gleimia hominis]